MPVTMSVRIEGLDHLEAALRGMPRELRIEQRKGVNRALAVLTDEVRRRIHSPGGHAAAGIRQKVTGTGVTITVKVYPGGRGGRAAIFSQRSRGAGRTPPPVRPLRRWAKAHGINPYVLARSIGRRGTRGHPVVRASFQSRQAEVVHMFREALEAVARMATDRA